MKPLQSLMLLFLLSCNFLFAGKINAINLSRESLTDTIPSKQKTDSIKNKSKYDVETGLDLPSNFIKKKHTEVYFNTSLYTQTALYNASMNRLDDPFRYSAANASLKVTYGILKDANFAIQFIGRQSVSEPRSNPATDVYTVAGKYKASSSNLIFMLKVKFWERKARISGLMSFSIPTHNQLPESSKAIEPLIYTFKGVLYYDRYVTSFLRSTISLDGELNYNSINSSVYLRLRPQFHFSSILYQRSFFKATVGMNLFWNIYTNTTNFVGLEYVVLNFKLSKNFSIAPSYNYNFIGARSGAGHSFNLGIRYYH